MKRKIIFLAAVLVVLVAVVLFLKRGGSSERNQSIFSADSTQISRIKIISSEDTIVIEPGEKNWNIVEPIEWMANPLQVSAFFKDVIRATSSMTVMTDNRDAVQRYGLVDGEALQVMIWDKKNRLKDHVYFNNFGQSFDYFRYADSNEIYQMRLLISQPYSIDLQYWRSPVLLRVFEDVLSSIDVSYTDNSYKLVHENDKWIYRDASASFQIHHENRPLLRALNVLNNLDTMQFYDGDNSQYLPAFENPECTLILNLTDGKKRKLAFAMIEENSYALMMDDSPSPLFGIAKDTMQRFTLHKDYFRQLPYGATPPPIVD